MKILIAAIFVLFLSPSLAAEVRSDKYVACYFASWTNYRPGNGKFDIPNINVDLCTHLYFAFVGLNPNGTLHTLDSWYSDDDGLKGFRRFIALKEKKPSLKLIVSMGGWNEGSENYSKVSASPSLRMTFTKSVLAFLEQWGFDGFDLDWEYPTQRGGSSKSDKENMVLLLQDLRKVLQPKGKLMAAAVSGGIATISEAYDIAEISKVLDIVNVMAYDYRPATNQFVAHPSPLYKSSLDTGSNATMNVNSSIEYYLQHGVSPSKLSLGIGLNGRSYVLADANNTGLYAPVSGPGNAGPYTQEMGTLDYKEICELHNSATYKWDDEQKVPSRVQGNLWIGYEDERSIKEKINYVKSKKLGGVTIWAVDQDDFNGICGRKYPLLNTINENINN